MASKTTSETRDAVAIVVLAGGQSRRMGHDKAKLILREHSLLEDLVRVASGVRETVLVVGREEDVPPGVRGLSDEVPGQGPLGGLVTALSHTNSPVLLIACDMPNIDEVALRWLLSAPNWGPHGLVTRYEGQLQPLFAIYTPAVAPLARARLSERRRSLHGLVEAGDFGVAELPTSIASCLINLNAPHDVTRWRKDRRNRSGD